MFNKVIYILLFTSIYTVTRYFFFGDVPAIQMPVYLLNKSMAMASVIFLFSAALNSRKGNEQKVKYWANVSLISLFIHILLSLAILSKTYYPKFFGSDKMNLTGELTIMFGTLAAGLYWMMYNGKNLSINKETLRLIAALFVAGHLLSMGFSGWLQVQDWHGGMPPITLLTFILTSISLLLFLKHKN